MGVPLKAGRTSASLSLVPQSVSCQLLARKTHHLWARGLQMYFFHVGITHHTIYNFCRLTQCLRESWETCQCFIPPLVKILMSFTHEKHEDHQSYIYFHHRTIAYSHINPLVDQHQKISPFSNKSLLLPSIQHYIYVFGLILFIMPTTLDILASRMNANSSIHKIGIQCTRTEYCSNHWYIVLTHEYGENTSVNVIKGQDGLHAVEWARNIDLHPSKSIIFNATYKCSGVQDLAVSIFNQGHLESPQTQGCCCCSQWV